MYVYAYTKYYSLSRSFGSGVVSPPLAVHRAEGFVRAKFRAETEERKRGRKKDEKGSKKKNERVLRELVKSIVSTTKNNFRRPRGDVSRSRFPSPPRRRDDGGGGRFGTEKPRKGPDFYYYYYFLLLS